MSKSPRLLYLFLLSLLAVAVYPAPASAQLCRVGRHVDLPVTPLGNVPVVAVSINGLPANFLFDTGAERTVLTAAAAKRLGVVPHFEYARRMRSIGGAVAGGDARLQSVALGGMTIPDVRVLVGPVSLPPVEGKAIDGLLGADFLADFEVDLDLSQRRVLLYQPPPCPITGPAWSEPYTTIRANRSLHDRLFFPVSLDGHRFAALIDTGAQLTALDTGSAAALGVTGQTMARDPVATLRGAAAEIIRSRVHRFSRLEIDGEVIRDPVIVVAGLGLQDADLVIGANFLRLHRVWLSYASHLIFISRP